MNAIGHMRHSIGKFGRVHLEVASGVPACRPAVVDKDVFIPEILETEIDHDLGRGEDDVFRDIAAEGVPSVLSQKLLLFRYDRGERFVSTHPAQLGGYG